MNPTAYGLLQAADRHDVIESTERAPGLPRRQPRRGAHSATVTVEGVDFEVTFDLEGERLAATETDPAEFPTVNVVSVTASSPELFGDQARYWDERAELWDLIGVVIGDTK